MTKKIGNDSTGSTAGQVSTIDGLHDVPSQDSSDNNQMRDAIGNKTDTISGDSLVALIKQALADTIKIDEATTDGLSGVNNSLSYRVHEIEKHFHNKEKWFGDAASPSGETHVADRIGGSTSTFQLTAGNNDFNSSWTQILGSSDTPVESGKAKFDLHRFLITSTNSTSPFVVQIVSGESSGIAAKIAAEDFTEFVYISATNNNDSGISDIMDVRLNAGEKVWARCACIGQNGTTIDLYFGIHEYDG